MKKTLKSIVLTGALSLSEYGCLKNPEYSFYGNIGEEQVRFHEESILVSSLSFLDVIKRDGGIVRYWDYGSDLVLDSVQVRVGNNTTKYSANSSNPVAKEIVQKAQKEFDSYLTKITEIQTVPLNR